MKRAPVLLALVLAVGLVFAVAAPAGATCALWGQIVYSYVNTSAAVPVAYYYLSTSTLPTYYYYFQTTRPDLIDTMNSAQAAQHRVYVVGNATSCPTTGTSRYIGLATYGYVANIY